MVKGRIKEIEVKAVASDADFAKNEGKFFEAKDYRIFNEDVDVYALSHPDDVAAGKSGNSNSATWTSTAPRCSRA